MDIFAGKLKFMSHEIVKIGFNVIRDNIESDSLEDNLLIFDNFSGENKVPEMMTVTDYPIRLNKITMIVFCVGGYIKFNLGLKNMMLSKNQLCVILPDQIIQTTEVSPDFKAGSMVLRRNFFDSRNHFMETLDLHKNLREHSYLNLSDNEMQEYLQIFNIIKEKIANQDNPYHLQIIQNYVQITFYNIYNYLTVNQKSTSENTVVNNNMAIYERFIKSVEEHYRKEHSVKFYADLICLTPKYLSSIVYEISGKHASDWIHEYILLEAKALLKSTNMSLKNISDVLCFCTPSHFGRFFKRYTGYTPSEYQKL